MFQIEKDLLIDMLRYSALSVADKSISKLAKAILFTGKDGVLTIRTYDSISETLVTYDGLEMKDDFEFAVDSFISKILMSLPGKSLQFKAKDNKIIVTSGSAKNSFACIDISEYPDVVNVPKLKYTKITDKKWFVDLFKKSSFAISQMNDKPILKTFDINAKDGRLIAADGDKIIRIIDEGIDFGFNANPEARLLNPLLSLVSSLTDDDTLEVFLGPTNCFKITTTFTVETKMPSHSGGYPENANLFLDQLLNEEPLLTLKADTTDLKDIMSQCLMYYERAFKEGKPHQTKMDVDGTVNINMAIQDFSEISRDWECEVIGDEKMQIQFLSRDLVNALAVMSDKIELRFFAPGLVAKNRPTPFLMLDQNNPKIVYLQVQMYE